LLKEIVMNHCCTRWRPTSFRPCPVLTGRPNPALRPLPENRGVHGTGQRLRPAPAYRRRRPVGKVAWSTTKGWGVGCEGLRRSGAHQWGYPWQHALAKRNGGGKMMRLAGQEGAEGTATRENGGLTECVLQQKRRRLHRQ
jgi:hypothetical protein